MITTQTYYNDPSIWGNSQYTNLKDIVTDYMDSLLPDNHTYNVPKRNVIKQARNAIKLYNRSAVRDITALELDLSSSLQITLPLDYSDYLGIYWVSEQGKLYPMAKNKRLNVAKGILQDDEFKFIYDDTGEFITAQGSTPSVDDTILALSNFNFDRGQEFANGDFRIDQEAGVIQFGSNAKEKTIVIEYVSDGLFNKSDADIRINSLANDPIDNYIYFHLIKRLDKVPQSEKDRARRDWKISERVMNSLLNPIRLEDVLQTNKSKSRWVKQS